MSVVLENAASWRETDGVVEPRGLAILTSEVVGHTRNGEELSSAVQKSSVIYPRHLDEDLGN